MNKAIITSPTIIKYAHLAITCDKHMQRHTQSIQAIAKEVSITDQY